MSWCSGHCVYVMKLEINIKMCWRWISVCWDSPETAEKKHLNQPSACFCQYVEEHMLASWSPSNGVAEEEGASGLLFWCINVISNLSDLKGRAVQQTPSAWLKGKSNFQGYDSPRIRLHRPPSQLPMSLDVVTFLVYSPAPSHHYRALYPVTIHRNSLWGPC